MAYISARELSCSKLIGRARRFHDTGGCRILPHGQLPPIKKGLAAELFTRASPAAAPSGRIDRRRSRRPHRPPISRCGIGSPSSTRLLRGAGMALLGIHRNALYEIIGRGTTSPETAARIKAITGVTIGSLPHGRGAAADTAKTPTPGGQATAGGGSPRQAADDRHEAGGRGSARRHRSRVRSAPQ